MKASGSIKVLPAFWFYPDLAGGHSDSGDETAGLHIRYLDECGCDCFDRPFQDEIRRFLLTLGSHRHVSALAHFFSGARKEALKHDDIMPVVMACLSMGKQKVGALIVIEHTTPLDEVVRTGEIIDAAISQRLIENIFFKNSPLHDGAMVISKNGSKPQAVSCQSLTT